MASFSIIVALLAASAVLMLIERRGVPMTLPLKFKGDVKRETRWLVQYGQSACTPVAVILVWQLDPLGWQSALVVAAAVGSTAILAMLLKRLLGRVRPGRKRAGRFLGPTWRHANYRESFPSSHSACAFALSAVLASFYPQAAITFWALAVVCAVLRFLLDAHWPSDVVAGTGLGYGLAHAVLASLPRG